MQSKQQHTYKPGDRVLINRSETGTVILTDKPAHFGIWVFSHKSGYSCDFDLSNITPVDDLPSGVCACMGSERSKEHDAQFTDKKLAENKAKFDSFFNKYVESGMSKEL